MTQPGHLLKTKTMLSENSHHEVIKVKARLPLKLWK